MRKLIFPLMFLSSLFAQDVFAACEWVGPIVSPDPVKEFILPARTVINAVPIGKELAKHRMDLWTVAEGVRCTENQTASLTMNGGLIPSALPKVYETGIKGVGVKFCLALNPLGNDNTFCVPFYLSNRTGLYTSRFIDVVFVRTDRAVASGNIPMNVDVIWKIGEKSLVARTRSSTELVNDVFFAGCESVGAAVNVQMGKQTIQHIKNGSVKEVPFNFDVRCDGLKPDTKVPVKVYFEGNSQADGMLKLANLGQAGVASGVGISLVSDKGVKLPFAISRSIALDWNREIAEGSIYRFSGSAKYVPTGGEIKPGKGDATMSFVLNYN
ncbi:fimbrial protein [Pseudomonas chlororaphis]